MSEFLRRHLVKLRHIRDVWKTDNYDFDIEEVIEELIADVEAHQKVLKLKKPAPLDYSKMKFIADAEGYSIPYKSEPVVDWNALITLLAKNGWEIPTIPSIYETKREETPDDE